jgi:prepilin-type N-terminal cleavage/methylation domain-containing protein/prepilin-type processing-associated H-X9-DG protein
MNNQKKAFTLIELLVVIAIIAILAAILFPVFAQAKLAAKKTQDLSNVKNIGMAFQLYAADADDAAPFSRVVADPSHWWTANMTNWKDLIYPYVKNGGGRQNNVGQVFMTNGDGGIFQSPISGNAWSNAPVWWTITGGNGDETTRWPRSYAINMSAGQNEGNGQRWWPNVGDSGGSGNMTFFEKPANTIMIASTKLPFPDIDIWTALTYQCTAQGQPWGGTNIGCSMTDTRGGANYVYFDGHAKHSKIRATVSTDAWGINNYLGAANIANINANAATIKEYN